MAETLSEAELEDAQTIADQTGQSLAEVIAAVAWQNDFSLLVDQIISWTLSSPSTAWPSGSTPAAVRQVSGPIGFDDADDQS